MISVGRDTDQYFLRKRTETSRMRSVIPVSAQYNYVHLQLKKENENQEHGTTTKITAISLWSNMCIILSGRIYTFTIK